MCDFREITKIEVNGKVIDANTKYIQPADMDKVKEEGFYKICCTGSFYLYYDGKQWRGEKDESKKWQETYPPLWKVVEFTQCDCFGQNFQT